MLGFGFVGALTGFAGTALAYLWPLRSGPGSDLLSGSEGLFRSDDIPVNTGVVGRSSIGKILVVRTDDRLVGVTATCTHLGCTVTWNVETRQIECPCHGARYNLRGEVLRGPARDPLDLVELSEVDEGIRVISAEV